MVLNHHKVRVCLIVAAIMITLVSVMPGLAQTTAPDLVAEASCAPDGSVIFVITNIGGDMIVPDYTVVMDSHGNLIDQIWLLLAGGDSVTLQYPAMVGTVTLFIGNGMVAASIECNPPAPEPPPPSCQSDCYNLEVSGVCDANVAVFTIANTGESGAGDMLTPTEYRLIVDSQAVESGTVLLAGQTSMQVEYDGKAIVTLEVDQSDNSTLQETLDCHGGNNGVGNGVDPQPPGNPPVNDGPGTGPGNPGNKGGHGNSHGGNNGVGNGVDPQPPGNPPVNDGPGTGPGNPGHKGGIHR